MINTLFIVLLGVIIVSCLIIWKLYKAMLQHKKRADEASLAQSEKRFEALVENGLDCVIIISPTGTPTYVSSSIINILGYTPEEVINIDFRDLTHPDDIAGAEQALAQTIQQPGVPIQGYTSRIKHKDGTWRWIEPVVTNMMHEPSINGIVDNIRDVTDRIKAEEELKKTNERFILATKGSKLGIWDQDLVNDKLIWDEAMYQIYDITDSSFTLNSDSWMSLIHQEDRPLLEQQVEDLMNDSKKLDIEFRILRPDSSVRYIRSFAQLYHDDHGKAVRVVGTNLDITNNKEYEQTLEQILFDISHIIRKPVSNILGLSHLIDTDTINKTALQQTALHMKSSAKELDDFTIALTDTYLKKKMSMKGLSDKAQ